MNKFRKLSMLVFSSMLLLCMGLLAVSCGSKTYSVHTEYDSTQGSITLSPETEDNRYEQGKEIIVTVEAATNYELEAFTVNGEAKELSGGVYKFVVEEDTVIKATFKEKQQEVTLFKVTVTAPEHGVVNVAPEAENGRYAEGTEITVTLVPEENYVVDTFTLDGVDKKSELANNVYKFHLTGDATVAATFKATYAVTVIAPEHGSVNVTPEAENGRYAEGTEVTVTLVPEENYVVDTFTLDGVDKKFELANNVYKFHITGDATVAATFKATYAVTVTAPEHGSVNVTPEAENGRYAEGTEITVTLVPEENYVVDTFTLDGVDKKSELANNVYKFHITGDATVAATFKATYAVTVIAPEHGSVNVTPEAENGRYAEGTEVTVTLVPEENYVVDTFTLDGVDKKFELANNVYKFHITGDATVAATFMEVYRINVEIEPADKATYTFSPSEGPYEADTVVTFTLIPADDYVPGSLSIDGETQEWDDPEAYSKKLTIKGNVQIHVTLQEEEHLFSARFVGEWHVVSAASSNIAVAEESFLDFTKDGVEVNGTTATVEAIEEGFTLTVGEIVYTLKEIYAGALLSLETGSSVQYLIKSATLVPVVLPEALQGVWAYGDVDDPKLVDIKSDGTIALPFLGNAVGTVICHDETAKKFVTLNAYYGTFTWLVATYSEGVSLSFTYNSRNGTATQECRPAPTTLTLKLDEKTASGGELVDFYVENFQVGERNEDGTYTIPVNAKVSFKIKAPDGYDVHEVASSTVTSYPNTITPNNLGYYEISTVYKVVTITITYWKSSIFTEDYLGDWCRITHGTTSAATSAMLSIKYNGGRDSIEYESDSASDIGGNAMDGYTFTTGSYSSKKNYKFLLVDNVLLVWTDEQDASKNEVKYVLIKKGTSLAGETLSADFELYGTSWSSENGSLITISETGEIKANVSSDIATTNTEGDVTVLSNHVEDNKFAAFVDVHYGRYYTFTYDATKKTLTISDYFGHSIVFNPTPETYSIETKLSPNDAATVTLSDPKYKAGYTMDEEVTVTIKINVGYEVESVKVGTEELKANQDGVYTFAVEGDTTVDITFTTYDTVHITYTRTGGSYPTAYLESADDNPYSGTGYSASVYTFKKGAEATLRVSRSTSNRVVSVVLQDESGAQTSLTASTGENASYDYYNFTADKNYTLTATFIQTFKVSINAVTNGTVTIQDGDNVYESNGSYYVDKDSAITITPTPTEGYHIASVKAGTSSYNAQDIPLTGEKYTYTVTKAITIYVTFEADNASEKESGAKAYDHEVDAFVEMPVLLKDILIEDGALNGLRIS